MEDKKINSFERLSTLNVNEHIDKKTIQGKQLSYLSWSPAWGIFAKEYPEATYEIKKNDIGLPYFLDKAGAMVYTTITAEGVTREMWLPVLDGANKPMKSEPYTYTTKYGEKSVEAINMFDVNKTIMRCLVKNMAMFGLGLYIYAKEDLPEQSEQERLEMMFPAPSIATEKQTKSMQQQYVYLLGKQNIKELDFRKFLVKKELQASQEMYKWLRDESKLQELINEFQGV